jgi:hypothetical protein
MRERNSATSAHPRSSSAQTLCSLSSASIPPIITSHSRCFYFPPPDVYCSCSGRQNYKLTYTIDVGDMMKAIHCICHRENGEIRGMRHIDPSNGLYILDCWIVENPEELIGGWLYLHERCAEGAYLAGIIREVTPCITRDQWQRKGVAFTFRVDRRGDRKRWRGPAANQQRFVNVVSGDYPHEKDT